MKAQVKRRQVQLKWETGYHATLKTAKKGLYIHLQVNICHARKKKKRFITLPLDQDVFCYI